MAENGSTRNRIHQKKPNNPANNTSKELNNLWEDMDEGEPDNMDPVVTPFTVPLINGGAVTIKHLANTESVKNLELRVQLDGNYSL